MLTPGNYVNKRGEVVQLFEFEENSNLLWDKRDNYYTHTGTCMFWHLGLERFVMNTDPKSDLQLLPSPPLKCRECNRDF